MLLVVIAWVAYFWFSFQVITRKLQIADFTTSIVIIGAGFFLMLYLSVNHLLDLRRRRPAVDPQPVDDSGSFTFRAAGTTFDNDDGTSRQDILRHLKFGDPPWADDPEDLSGALEETTHDGRPAVAVLVNGYQIGFVPKNSIPQVQEALASVATCYVSDVRIIGGGTGDDGRRLSYGCEITLVY